MKQILDILKEVVAGHQKRSLPAGISDSLQVKPLVLIVHDNEMQIFEDAEGMYFGEIWLCRGGSAAWFHLSLFQQQHSIPSDWQPIANVVRGEQPQIFVDLIGKEIELFFDLLRDAAICPRFPRV